jgi:hypothetical protein
VQKPLFIVSTGRCGSTLLSSVLQLHPQVCSLSELFTSISRESFALDLADGPTLWRSFSVPRPTHNVWLRLLSAGVAIDEFRYPVEAALRFLPEGIPPILAMTLPCFSGDPDALYEALGSFVCSLPTARLGRQYRKIFAWLAEHQGRRIWCERSGGSLAFAKELLWHFPEARFVHVYRDGREQALSASRFPPIKLTMTGAVLAERTGVNPYQDPAAKEPDDLPSELRGLWPQHFDAEAFRRFEVPLERFGASWSSLIEMGKATLFDLPPERLLHVRYEALTASPARELDRVIRFLDPGLADPAWLAQAAGLVRSNPLKWTSLPAAERGRLEEACRPGMEILRDLA